MQMLYEASEEFEYTKGLGLLRGTVRKINSGKPIMLPHIGWNKIVFSGCTSLTNLYFEELDQYFVHSYVAEDIDVDTLLYKCMYQDFDVTCRG